MKKVAIVLLLLALMFSGTLAAAKVEKRELFPTDIYPNATGFVNISEQLMADGEWRTHLALHAYGLPADSIFVVYYGNSYLRWFRTNATGNGNFRYMRAGLVKDPGGRVYVTDFPPETGDDLAKVVLET